MALQMKDKYGYLPIHIYCKRECSIGKLQILYEGFPNSVFEKTPDGDTPLSLVVSFGEKKGRPNYTCIDYLENRMILNRRASEIAQMPANNLNATVTPVVLPRNNTLNTHGTPAQSISKRAREPWSSSSADAATGATEEPPAKRPREDEEPKGTGASFQSWNLTAL